MIGKPSASLFYVSSKKEAYSFELLEAGRVQAAILSLLTFYLHAHCA
jgi:hypothetical protein